METNSGASASPVFSTLSTTEFWRLPVVTHTLPPLDDMHRAVLS